MFERLIGRTRPYKPSKDGEKVNYEFLGNEAIENVITCLNYHMDRVVFFGYKDLVASQEGKLTDFLKKYCDVPKVEFIVIEDNNLQAALHVMREKICSDIRLGNYIFFDITGGEELILVAFGMLASEYFLPIHSFDINENIVRTHTSKSPYGVMNNAEPKKVDLDIDSYIKLYGGAVNSRLQKKIKGEESEELSEDISKIYDVASRFFKYWNPFSDILKDPLIGENNLHVNQSFAILDKVLNKHKTVIRSKDKFFDILDALGECGILKRVRHAGMSFSFTYKDADSKALLWEGGSVLEMHVFGEEKEKSHDCMVGVHIDWDGVIHEKASEDVFNEIDVLSIKGNVPTFISCKSGKMDNTKVLHSLYELKTVADRFGGDHAKKVLVIAQQVNDIYLERAKIMGIEVRRV